MISQKRLLLAALMIIVAISLAGWGIWLWSLRTLTNGNTNAANANISNINATLNDNVNSQPLNINSQPIDTSDWQTYRNEELGFEVKIPPSWGEYKITFKKTANNLGLVAFAEKAERVDINTNGKAFFDYTVLAITLVSDEWWKKELSYNTPHPGFLESSKRGVYITSIGQDPSSQWVYDEVLEVIKTFKLID